MQRKRKLPPVLGLLYTHNPFYLLSTCFVLYAVKRAFQPGVAEYINPWALMAALTGFTLLAAITAWVVVRFGKVWEDARSIVLVLVLMFLAISVSFDELLNLHPEQAKRLLAFGFGYSILVTETILRSLRIRLPAAYRLPFYLILGLFFAWPAFVSPEVTGLNETATRWRIAAFPAAAGVVTLLLLVAVRRGKEFVEDNGTPWRWPWFPWTVFGFLAFAVCARSYSLSISFDESVGPLTAMNSIFGGYFLIPFLLAVLVLLLEIGVVEEKPGLRTGVVFAAALLPLLALPMRRDDPTFAAFLSEFTVTLASPVFLTVVAVLLLCLYAWWRGAVARIDNPGYTTSCETGATSMLLLLTIIGPKTLGAESLTAPQLWPLAVLAALQLLVAIRHRSSARLFACFVCVIAAAMVTPWPAEWQLMRQLFPTHALLAAMASAGLLFRDRFARVLSVAAAVVLPPLCLLTARILQDAVISEAIIAAYFAGMTALAMGHWYFTRDRWYLAAGLLAVACGSGGVSWRAFQELSRRFGADVVQPLLYGIAFFLIAALISAHKAGAFNGVIAKRSEPGGG